MKLPRSLLAMIVALACLPSMHGTGQARAELAVAGLFGDRMVLQREKPVRIWGTATAGEQVTVEIGGQTNSTVADAAGHWQVVFDPLAANATGQQLTARVGEAKAGPEQRVFNDVVIGDVWLLAGGADVARAVMHLPPSNDGTTEFKPDATRNVRVCMIPQRTAREPESEAKAPWQVVGAGDPARLAAEPALLAQAIAAAIEERGGKRVPVGVIAVANAKPIECWMSRETLAATPAAKPIVDFYASDAWKSFSMGTYEDRMKAWLEYNQKLPLNPLPKPKPDDDTSRPQQEPASVWNSMIAPLAQPAGFKESFLAIRGVVWDQGEDWATQNRAIQQGALLAALVPAWRTAFGDPALPFAVVQLKPHRYALGVGGIGIDGRLAAELREAQIKATEEAKATLVTTIDLPADPTPARIVERIARVLVPQAPAGLSGSASAGKETARGPQLVSAEPRGDSIVLTFRNTNGGLTAKGGKLEGFAIAASPMRWVWADATIEGDTVVLSSPAVPKPEGVRYAYEDLPTRAATLCDARGEPALPFRTDAHLTLTGSHLDPGVPILRFSRHRQPAIEDSRLPRVLIIGDSISGHYLERLRLLMDGKANIVGEASMDKNKNTWAAVGNRFYRSDAASRGDDLKNYLAESGPWDIVHFNNGIHMFSRAKPGDEKPYAEQLRKVVATIRESGAVCLFANSTGTPADNTIPSSPNYLTNCRAFNAAAEEVMRELSVPVTDIHGLIQPRIKELISADLIHTNAEADQMMAELIATRLKETMAALPSDRPRSLIGTPKQE